MIAPQQDPRAALQAALEAEQSRVGVGVPDDPAQRRALLGAMLRQETGALEVMMPEQTLRSGFGAGFIGTSGTMARAARLPEAVIVNTLGAFGLDGDDEKVVRGVLGSIPMFSLARGIAGRGERAQEVAGELGQGRETFAGSVGQAAGSAAAMAPAGIAGGALGGAAGGALFSGATGAAIEAESMLEQGEALGASPGQKLAAMGLGAAVGSTEAFGADRALASLGKVFASGTKEVKQRVAVEILHAAGRSALEEGLEEIGQGLGEEAIAEFILEDPDKHGRSVMDWLRTAGETALDQGLPAAVVGMVLGGATRAASVVSPPQQGEPATGQSIDPNATLTDFGAVARGEPTPSEPGPTWEDVTPQSEPQVQGEQVAPVTTKIPDSSPQEPVPGADGGASTASVPVVPDVPVSAAEAAQEQPRAADVVRPPRYDEMTPDEMDAEADRIVASEEAAMERVMPDATPEQRRAALRRSDRDGGAAIEKMMEAQGLSTDVDNPSPEWRAIFGQDDPKNLRRIASDIRFTEAEDVTPEQIAQAVGSRILDALSAQQALSAGRDPSSIESESLARLKAAGRAAQARGLDPMEVRLAIQRRLLQLGYSEDDFDVFAPFFGKAQQQQTPAKSLPPQMPTEQTMFGPEERKTKGAVRGNVVTPNVVQPNLLDVQKGDIKGQRSMLDQPEVAEGIKPERSTPKKSTMADRVKARHHEASSGRLGFRAWVRAMGGLNVAKSGDLAGEVRDIAESGNEGSFGLGPLVRGAKSQLGVSVDAVLEAAMERGYLPPGSGVRDVFDLIESDFTPEGAQAESEKMQAAEAKAFEEWVKAQGFKSVEEFQEVEAQYQREIEGEEPRDIEDVETEGSDVPFSPARAAMPVRLESPAVKTDPTSAPEVVDALAKTIEAAGGGTPIRTGRMGRAARRAEGFFKVRPEVIRLRTANDIPTAAHEAAHALEKHVYGWPKGGPWKNPLVNLETQKELVKLGRALYGDRKPSAGYKREGFAEYVRLYVSDPASAQTEAPNFHAWFTGGFLPSQPQIAKQLNRARDLATKWREQGAVQRARASVIDPASMAARWKKMKARLRYTRIVSEVLESGQALKEAQSEAETRALLDVDTSPFSTFDELRLTHDAKVAYMAEKAMIDFDGNKVGGSLADVTPLIKGRYHDFLVYLWAKRALALRESGRNAGISIEDAGQVVKELGSEKFQLAASKLYAWNDGVLDYISQASPHFARVVQRIRAVDPGSYIPLQREMDEIDRTWSGRVNDGGSPLKKLRGSGRRVKDPIQTMLARTRKLVLAAHQRKVMDQVIALSKVEGMGKWVEEVPVDKVPLVKQSLGDVLKKIEERVDPMGEGVEGIDKIREQFFDLLDLSLTEFGDKSQPDTKDPIIPYWDDGQVRWFQVDPDLYRSLSTMEVYRLPGIIGAIAGGATRTFRAGTTGLRATFGMVRNPLRDVQALLLQSRSTASAPTLMGLWLQQMGRSFISSVTAGKVTDEWADLAQRLGVTMAQPLGQDIAHTKRAARRLAQGTVVRTMDPRNWFDWYREFVQFPEGATRTAELRAIARDIGYKPGDQMTREQAQRLTLAGKKVTTDFTAGGSFARVMNQIVPFHNSAIQGPRAAAQAIKHHPVKFMLRGMALTAATLALWYENRDKEWWKEIPDEEKYGYWHFEIQNGDKTEIVRIPRAYEIGGVFAALPEAVLEAWYADDPESAEAWVRQFLATTTPDITPAAAKPIIEWLANYDLFRERPIVPRGEQDKPVEEQAGPYTSRLAKVFGDKIGASPRKIDHAVNSIFGPVAGDVITAIGMGAQARAARGELAETPVVGTLFRRGGTKIGRPKSVEKVYDAYAAALEIQASDRVEETREQRNARLLLADAVLAIGALSFIRWESDDEGVRETAYREMLSIAKDAQAEIAGGDPNPRKLDRAAKIAKRDREELERERTNAAGDR